MKVTRAQAIPAIFRKLPEHIYTSVLSLKKEYGFLFCRCCKEYKPIVDFYCESPSKGRWLTVMKKQCISCWDKYKGKDPHKSLPMTNDLSEFIDDGESDERRIPIYREISTKNSRGLYPT